MNECPLEGIDAFPVRYVSFSGEACVQQEVAGLERVALPCMYGPQVLGIIPGGRLYESTELSILPQIPSKNIV